MTSQEWQELREKDQAENPITGEFYEQRNNWLKTALLPSQEEQAVAGAIVAFASCALKSRSWPSQYIANADYWPYMKKAQDLAQDPENVDEHGRIKIESWSTGSDITQDMMFCHLYGNGMTSYQYEWGLPAVREAALNREVFRRMEEWRKTEKFEAAVAKKMAQEIIAICDRDRMTEHKAWNQEVIDYVEKIEQRYETRNEESLASFGIPSIDRALGKVRPSELVVISSEAKGGKTTLCYQMIDESCLRRNIPTLLISLEMTKEQVLDRLTARIGGVDSMRLQSGNLADMDFAKITTAVSKLKGIPLTVVDDNRQTADSVQALTEYHAQISGIKLVVLDYFQLLDNDGGSKRFEQLENFSRRFAGIAKEMGIVFVAISQLNEKGYTAGSRQLEKDCHRLIKIQDGENEGRKIVNLALNRWGPSRSVDCLFYGSTHRFQEVTQSKAT